MNDMQLDLCLEYLNSDGESSIDSFIEKYFEENVYITSQDIQSVIENFKNFSINEGFVAKALNLEEPLKKLGFSSATIYKMNAIVSRSANDIARSVKSEGISKGNTKKFLLIIQKAVDEMGKSIYGEAPMIAKRIGGEPGKVVASLYMMGGILTVATICQIIIALLFGLTISNVISAVILAPLLEELGKRYAIQNGFYNEFQAVFNIIEFSEYVYVGAPLFGLLEIVTARTIAVFKHLLFGLIQLLFNNKKIQKMLGIDIRNEEDRKACNIIGYIIAVCMHALNNASAWIKG